LSSVRFQLVSWIWILSSKFFCCNACCTYIIRWIYPTTRIYKIKIGIKKRWKKAPNCLGFVYRESVPFVSLEFCFW
jgi:hypothetical protein